MAQEIKFNELLEVLINHTGSKNCKWDNLGNEQYRILLPSGSVVISKLRDNFSNSSYYKIDVYDLKSRIAGDVVYDYEKENAMLGNMKKLYDKILDAENQKINCSIQNLISDLDNPWKDVK